MSIVMLEVEVRFYQSHDLASTVDCFAQLLSHYSPKKIFIKSVLKEKIDEQFADDHSTLKLIVALDQKKVIGLATTAELFPAMDDTTQLFIKELFVKESYRRRGVATTMMKFIAHYALENGMNRIDWLVDSDNEAAMSFYRRFAGDPISNKSVFRLENEALQKFNYSQ